MYTIEKIVDFIMYSGPTINELLQNTSDDNSIHIYFEDKLTIIEIETILPYKKRIIDQYIYNENSDLIKQYIITKKKKKEVFDKNKEINALLQTKTSSVA